MLYILIPLALIAVWGISAYNGFVNLREKVNNSRAQIATQLESRWDALKSLIDATKQYSKHEAEVLEGVTQSRASIGQNSSVNELEENATSFNNVLGRLIAVAENYPDLKASTIYQSAMSSINDYENKVRQSRMIYNDTVTMFNRRTKTFPSNIVAKMFNFTPEAYFEVTESKTDMPSWE